MTGFRSIPGKRGYGLQSLDVEHASIFRAWAELELSLSFLKPELRKFPISRLLGPKLAFRQ